MSRNRTDPLFRLALAGVLIAACGLAACGRKGPLDLPPTAAAAAPAGEEHGLLSPVASPLGNTGSHSGSQVGPNGLPLTPKGEKRPFLLDPLLN